MKLKIELVPKTAWFDNLRSQLTKTQWDFIRKATYKRAGYCCEICGGKGDKHPVEAHEEWNYDEVTHIITLSRVTALCPMCHKCKHIGFAQTQGKEFFNKCVEHLCKINEQSPTETMKQIDDAVVVWKMRSQHEWQVDIENVRQYLKRHQIE